MKHWPMVPLAEVIKQRKEFVEIDDFRTYNRCRVQLHAKGVVLRDRVQGSEIKTKKQQICQTGDFLVAEIDAKMGGYGIVSKELNEAVVSSHYFLFAIDEAKLDRHFLGYFIKTPRFHNQVEAQGSTNYSAIRPGHVLDYTIPLPPMSQQLRMVQYLDTICAKITDARLLREYAIRETDALNASWANALFNGADADSWPIRNLGEVAEIQAGVTLGRTLTGRTIRRPYLRVANVQDGHLDLTTVKEVEIGFEEMEKWRLLSGDVLLTEGGDWDKLGRGTVWREEIPDCIHQNHIFRVRVDNSVLLPEFLSLQTASPYGRRYFHCASKQTTNLASINQRQLRAFPVKLPPIETQAKHLDRISRLRPLLTSSHLQQAAVMSELHAMQSAILNDVFCGVD